MGQEIGRKILLGFSFLILIPGYSEGGHVWDSWKDWNDNLQIIEFKDPCGTVKEHAVELNNFIGNKTVDIVAHSKAGLDARYYISHYQNNVKNLVMIATPNEGTKTAYMEVTPCWYGSMAGRTDLLPDSEATKTPDSPNTNYYVIAGNYPTPCFTTVVRWFCYIEENDGFVSVQSALSHYKSLGVFPYNHTGLLSQKDVHDAVKPIF